MNELCYEAIGIKVIPKLVNNKILYNLEGRDIWLTNINGNEVRKILKKELSEKTFFASEKKEYALFMDWIIELEGSIPMSKKYSLKKISDIPKMKKKLSSLFQKEMGTIKMIQDYHYEDKTYVYDAIFENSFQFGQVVFQKKIQLETLRVVIPLIVWIEEDNFYLSFGETHFELSSISHKIDSYSETLNLLRNFIEQKINNVFVIPHIDTWLTKTEREVKEKILSVYETVDNI